MPEEFWVTDFCDVKGGGGSELGWAGLKSLNCAPQQSPGVFFYGSPS